VVEPRELAHQESVDTPAGNARHRVHVGANRRGGRRPVVTQAALAVVADGVAPLVLGSPSGLQVKPKCPMRM
jgi:hypothetical protein